MIVVVLNPRTGKTEQRQHPFSGMNDVPTLTAYYRSRGLILVEATLEHFAVI